MHLKNMFLTKHKMQDKKIKCDSENVGWVLHSYESVTSYLCSLKSATKCCFGVKRYF